MGRPPKPKGLLLLSGAGRKNPKRLKERANEPEPPSLNIGPPPAKWKEETEISLKAAKLFAEGKTLNEVAAELNIPWEEARALREERPKYAEWKRLREVWYECAAMWPWNTFSERHTLERYCGLKLKEDDKTQTEGEKRLIQSLCVQLGGTGGGRKNLGGVLAPPVPSVNPSADRRNAFVNRKFG